MDEGILKSCSYKELKKIAVEHDLFKSVKSKKKDVLLMKLLEYFNKNSIDEISDSKIAESKLEENNTFDVSKDSTLKTNKRRGKNNDTTKSISGIFLGTLSETQENTDRRGTFVISEEDSLPTELSSLDHAKSPIKAAKSVRGRKKKCNSKSNEDLTNKENVQSQDVLEASGSTLTSVVKIEAPTCKDSSTEENQIVPKKPKSNRGRKNKSKDIPVESEQIQMDLPETQENIDRRGTFVISEGDSLPTELSSLDHSKSPIKTAKSVRGRKKKCNSRSNEDLTNKENVQLQEALVSEASGSTLTSVESELKIETSTSKDSSIEDNQIVPKKPKSNRGRKKKSKDIPVESEQIQVDLPVGPVSNADRRGTFSVSKPEKDDAAESPSVGKKRKRCESVINLSEVTRAKTSVSQHSSPAKKTKKAKVDVAVKPFIFNKTVNFMTPPPGRERSLARSIISLTPHPVKKSVTTPKSIQKTPGQFSAKKMPNFAKIHQKNFGSMESVVKYTERKAARNQLFSPINKTFSGLNTGKKLLEKLNETGDERKPSRSLIPRPRSMVRLNTKEKATSYFKKNHQVNVDAMREKEKNIIKGVRTNKRFMLQMKMRNLT